MDSFDAVDRGPPRFFVGRLDLSESRAKSALMIRPETASDHESVRRVIEMAFSQPAEADLVEALRPVASPQISLVAEEASGVVGHIFFSPVTIELDGRMGTALGLAPLAVDPGRQNQGIGSTLVHEGLKRCLMIREALVFVLGAPAYYSRFGFVTATSLGFRSIYSVPEEYFMAVELVIGAARGRSGLVKYMSQFDMVG